MRDALKPGPPFRFMETPLRPLGPLPRGGAIFCRNIFKNAVRESKCACPAEERRPLFLLDFRGYLSYLSAKFGLRTHNLSLAEEPPPPKSSGPEDLGQRENSTPSTAKAEDNSFKKGFIFPICSLLSRNHG